MRRPRCLRALPDLERREVHVRRTPRWVRAAAKRPETDAPDVVPIVEQPPGGGGLTGGLGALYARPVSCNDGPELLRVDEDGMVECPSCDGGVLYGPVRFCPDCRGLGKVTLQQRR